MFNIDLKKIYREQNSEQIFKPDAPYEKYPVIMFGLIFAMPILRFIQRYRFNPVLLSYGNLFSNILACICFMTSYLVTGALFFFTGVIFDLLDGSYARLTNQYNDKLKKIDNMIDRVGKLFCFFGIWYGQYYLTGDVFSGTCFVVTYYILEIFATVFFKDRFTNPSYPRFSIWEISFLIFFVAPIFNIVHLVLPSCIFLLWCLYGYIYFKKLVMDK